MITAIGWLGTILLSFSGAPQAFKCWRQGHARGLSICTLQMWFWGEVCYVIATIGEFGLVPWLLTNYVLNLFFIGVILRYWFLPRNVV
jgi:uncharacterized protein with PQ loop repeat